jgi:glutathione peroxidase
MTMPESSVLLALIAAAALCAGCTQSPVAAQPAPTQEEAPAPSPETTNTPAPESLVIDQEVTTIDGHQISLSEYRGQAILIVNTASECGYTPQLGGLQELYTRYQERGFAVLGFPCNDFGGQEPGTNEEIQTFCDSSYGVSFPLFDKVDILGAAPHPLYAALQNESGEGLSGPVRWNFTKFLIDPDGHVVGRFESAVTPMSDEITAAIEAVLPR